jgi:catechol 2,3-dioxygenase-like lactoylglutathione lyase family enzyme
MLAQVPLAMARRGRGVHFFFTVEDVEEFYRFVREGGLEVEPPSDEGWGGRFVTLEDPNRYRLFFVTWHEDGRRRNGSGGLNLPDAGFG